MWFINWIIKEIEMALDLTALKAAVAKQGADVAALKANLSKALAEVAVDIQFLNDKIAALEPGSITQAQLDALTTDVTAIPRTYRERATCWPASIRCLATNETGPMGSADPRGLVPGA